MHIRLTLFWPFLLLLRSTVSPSAPPLRANENKMFLTCPKERECAAVSSLTFRYVPEKDETVRRLFLYQSYCPWLPSPWYTISTTDIQGIIPLNCTRRTQHLSYHVILALQYGEAVFKLTDHLYGLTCIYVSHQVVERTLSLVPSGHAQDRFLNITDAPDSDKPLTEMITVGFHGEDGVPLSEVPLGRRVKLGIFLDPSSTYSGLALQELTATSRDGEVDFPLVVNRCPSEAASAESIDASINPLDNFRPKAKYTKLFAAFRFQNNPAVRFKLRLILCATLENTPCLVEPDCPGNRLRRNIERGNVTTIHATLRVLNPQVDDNYGDTTSGSNTEGKSQQCASHEELVIAVAIQACLLAVLVIFLAIVCFRRRWRVWRVSSATPDASQMTTT